MKTISSKIEKVSMIVAKGALCTGLIGVVSSNPKLYSVSLGIIIGCCITRVSATTMKRIMEVM